MRSVYRVLPPGVTDTVPFHHGVRPGLLSHGPGLVTPRGSCSPRMVGNSRAKTAPLNSVGSARAPHSMPPIPLGYPCTSWGKGLADGWPLRLKLVTMGSCFSAFTLSMAVGGEAFGSGIREKKWGSRPHQGGEARSASPLCLPGAARISMQAPRLAEGLPL